MQKDQSAYLLIRLHIFTSQSSQRLNTMETHTKEATFVPSSRPVGYAAEYLTCGTFAPRIAPASRLGNGLGGYALFIGLSPPMPISCILYHFPSYTAYINEIISLIGMHSSALASWARPHSRIRSAHLRIAGYAARRS